MTPENAATLPGRRRPVGRRRAPFGLAVVAFLLPASTLLYAAPRSPVTAGCAGSAGERACAYAGRPLTEALDDLRARGLNLIFSSDLVRPDMVVEAEPPAGAARRTLERLLAPFGLVPRDGPGRTILIVSGEETGATERAGPAAGGQVPSVPPLRERIRVGASSEDDPARRTTLKRENIEAIPSVGDDPVRMLTGLPGIASADKSARFGVRGGASDESRVILDGLEIEQPFHLRDFFAFSSIVDAATLGNARLLPGIVPAEYGGAASGIADLSTLEPDDAIGTALGASVINASVRSAGSLPGGRGGWLVSSRSWYPNAALDLVDPGSEDIHPAYNDLLGKVQFHLAGGSLLSLHMLASHDGLDALTDSKDARVKADDDHRHAWITWKMPWTPRLYSQTLLSSSRIGRSRYGRTLDSTGDAAQVEDSRSYGALGLKQDWVFAADERWSLKWGFDARRLQADYFYRSHVETGVAAEGLPGYQSGAGAPAVVDRDEVLEPSGLELGTYVAGRVRLFTPLILEAGFRYDRQTFAGGTGGSPRVKFVWTPGERTMVRAGWGRLEQRQGINELQVEDGVLDFYPAERTQYRELEFEHLFEGGLSLGVSSYYKDTTRVHPRYENLFDPIQLFPEAESDRVRVAPRRSVARGLEVGLGRERGRLAWRTSYALAWAEDRIDGTWTPRSWDQRHTFNFGLDYRRGERWRIGLTGIYHTGWPTTGVTAEQVLEPDGSTGIRPILGRRNALRYPAYHRLDLKVTRQFSVSQGTLEVYLEVTNLYGHDNVCCVEDFEYVPRADGGVSVRRREATWLQQLPVAGLKWEF